MTYSTVDDVFEVLPPEVQRPERVTVDGKGGVTQQTYESYVKRYGRSIDAELRKSGLPLPDPADPVDELLVAAEAHMVAGAIMRRFTSMQQQYKDAYATGNIFLRQYIDVRQLELGVRMGVPAFVIDTDPLPDVTRDGFPDL